MSGIRSRNIVGFAFAAMSSVRPESSASTLSSEASRLFQDLPFIGMAVTSLSSRRWLQVNQTLCDMLGWPREELVEKTWAELTHPDDLEGDVAHFERVMRGETDGYKIDKRFIRSDGAIVHATIDVKAIRRPDRTIDIFVATVSDITARVEAEAAARASAALVAKLAQHVPGVLFQYQESPDGHPHFSFADGAVEDIYEVTAEQLLEDAQRVWGRIHPEDRGRIRESLDVSARTLEPWRGEYRVLLPDRGLRWLDARARPERRSDGGTIWHGFVTDITDRQVERLALLESEERFRLQTEHAPDAILMFDPEAGRFVHANGRAEGLYGYPRAELLQVGWQDLSPQRQPCGRTSAEYGAEVVRRTLEGETVVFEWTFRHPSGHPRLCEVRLTRLPFEGRHFVRASVTDIGARKHDEARLRTSEERLLQAVRCSQVGIFDHDQVTDRMYWSPELRRIYDVGPEVTASISVFLDRVHPEDQPSIAQAIERAHDPEGDGLYDVESRLIWRSGEVRRIISRSQTLFDGEGAERRAVRTIGAVTDITARWRADEALRQFKSTLDQTNDCVFIFAEDTLQFSYVNQGACRQFGYSEAELLRMHPYDIKPEYPEPKFRALVAPLVAGEVPELRLETVHRHRSGHDIPVEIFLQFVVPTGGDGRFVAIVHDVSAQRQARETLLRLQAAVELSQTSLAIADLEGRLTYVNQAFLDLWGYASTSEVLGRRVDSFWKSPEKTRALFEQVRVDGQWSGERIAERADGAERTLQVSVSVFRDSHGDPAGVLGSFLDVTEAKGLQAQLVQSQKLESVGRLAGGIAHDFNNLLTVIKGYLEVSLATLPEDSEVRSDLQEVDRAADSAASLTQQLLAFSRRQIITPVALDLNEVVGKAHGMLLRLLGEDITLQRVTAPDLWRVRFDPGQAEQILLNLAVNARDAMPTGGRLTLETANVTLGEAYISEHPKVVPGDYVMLAVSDTGVGMSREIQERAFEPFYTTKESGRGTGLGLAVIHGAVSQNGGRVELYSEPGHGTSLKIYLPRTEAEAPDLDEASVPDLPRGHETIVLAEDDDGVRELAVRLLHLLGYRVHAFPDPDALLAWLDHRDAHADLLFTDVIMPGMNGRDLAERVTALRPGIKVLFVSGYTANVIVQHGVLKPGVDFLAKPYTRQQLARRLREVLDAEAEPDVPA